MKRMLSSDVDSGLLPAAECARFNRLCPFPESECGMRAPAVRSEFEVRQQERTRMGRELHDSTAQTLVALQLRVMYLKEMFDEPRYRGALSEVEQAVQELHQEIRAVSFINNLPPWSTGRLSSALRLMTARFGKMTGLQISLRAAEDCTGLPPVAETALYRVAQEALANVYRHAKASQVRLTLEATSNGYRLVIEDDGAGISTTRNRSTAGSGLRNIRSRIRELDGRFQCRRLAQGTRLTAVIPRARATRNGPANDAEQPVARMSITS